MNRIVWIEWIDGWSCAAAAAVVLGALGLVCGEASQVGGGREGLLGSWERVGSELIRGGWTGRRCLARRERDDECGGVGRGRGCCGAPCVCAGRPVGAGGRMGGARGWAGGPPRRAAAGHGPAPVLVLVPVLLRHHPAGGGVAGLDGVRVGGL